MGHDNARSDGKDRSRTDGRTRDERSPSTAENASTVGDRVVTLHRSIGNRAVQSLHEGSELQRKPESGGRDGDDDRDAVRIADRISEQVIGRSVSSVEGGTADVQRHPDGSSGDGGQENTPQIHDGKQGKHVPGHNNFIQGRSELTHPDPQQLVDDFAGTGDAVGNVPPGEPGYKERVDFGQTIGYYVDPASGEKSETTMGIIHYAKDGVHIVPARP